MSLWDDCRADDERLERERRLEEEERKRRQREDDWWMYQMLLKEDMEDAPLYDEDQLLA